MFGRKTKRLHSVPDWLLEAAAEMETVTHTGPRACALGCLWSDGTRQIYPLPFGGCRDYFEQPVAPMKA
jgi:hypothetical protein